MKISSFNHEQSAHCENGVTVNLLKHSGLTEISEPLVFGIGSGLFYIHIPFMVVNNGPGISFRTMPGAIFKRTCKALKVKVRRKKFRSVRSAEDYLDGLLQKKIPVGAQVGVYHLSYFPAEYRFHFNAHNLVVYGKEDGRYLISDPVMEDVTSIDKEELAQARFAKGPLAPRGHLYYTDETIQDNPDLIKKGIARGIKRNVRDMLRIPGSFAGVKGIVFTAGKIEKWRKKLGPRKTGLYLGQIVRMQEEIGTGGGGFRFLYAAFLQQAGEIFGNDDLFKASEMLTEAGDQWRKSAVQMAGIYKGRLSAESDFRTCADMMISISEHEKKAFQFISRIKLNA